MRSAVSALAVLALPAAAVAGTFDVKTPEIVKGQAEYSINSTLFDGFRANAERLRASSELGIAYGLTSWWKVGLKANIDAPLDENPRLSSLGVEQQVLLKPLANGFGIGWYSSVDVSTVAGDPDSTAFGPILQLGTEKTSLTLNPFLQRTFGPDRERGMALVYGWQAKHEIREGLAFGIEGYGVVPDIGRAPPIDQQEHRIGPVLYLERPLTASLDPAGRGGAEPPKFAIETGVLFGLTQGTQGTAVKLKAGVTF